MALVLTGLGSVVACPVLAQSAAGALYTLQTNCSLAGVAHRCQVEAFDGRDATVYRTTIAGTRTTFRLIDTPGRRAAEIWKGESRSWVSLDKLSLDFESRTLCLNGDQLCVENPNYFASLTQEYPDLGSDLIVARFAARTGRLSAICYSREACNAGF
ncbi:MAG: hypothetical protein ACKO0M_01830 [Cyanobium sp.]